MKLWGAATRFSFKLNADSTSRHTFIPREHPLWSELSEVVDQAASFTTDARSFFSNSCAWAR
eukprot:UN4717